MDTSIRQERIDPLGGLALDPSNELKFKGPFDNEFSTVTLTISNPTEKRIAFKIKTTAPKRYCVKPNSGVLDPSKSMKVNVLLQPFSHDPNEKLKHKFMVQYMYLNDEENKMDVQDILNRWKDVPGDRLLDIKLKCMFESEADAKQSAPTTTSSTGPATSSITSAAAALPQSSLTTNTDSLSSQISSDNNTELKLRAPKSNADKTNVNVQSSSSRSNNQISGESGNNFESASSSMEEEVRLKKLALPQEQHKTGTKPTSGQPDPLQNILMFLNNRSIWIIIVLLAIIIYLAFFKS